MRELTSERIETSGLTQLMELFWERGWTDGHPVVPPTEARVKEFLDYTQLEPNTVVGTFPERDRVFTAEKVAINAVMAGCKPEYMPVVIAAVEAICDPAFKFNHIATLGSAYPLFIVNGPIAQRLQINHGMYLFGPAGHRANATIGRAVSLLLWNCAEARPDGIQRGQWGNTIRSMSVIAENEALWEPLHVQLGFKKEESTVTALSQTPPSPITFHINSTEPEWMCQLAARAIAEASEFRKGTYLLIIGPAFAEDFIKRGWTKDDVSTAVIEQCYRSVAELKRRARLRRAAVVAAEFVGDPFVVKREDDEKLVYLFKNQPELKNLLFNPSELSRKCQIYIIVAGGDAGQRCAFVQPYGASTEPTTKLIRAPK